ncbi:hypothetical protein EVAR_60350_1 [Eumeta japonica]|uniref:Uncharacterized protein n=1 Tax=Eumeta variegata TaxID=151549 RepID=A0A4C1ZRJ7_EUMVA|nr:hypothetical protein EVAR_60350_1 [Eumeta japonica]
MSLEIKQREPPHPTAPVKVGQRAIPLSCVPVEDDNRQSYVVLRARLRLRGLRIIPKLISIKIPFVIYLNNIPHSDSSPYSSRSLPSLPPSRSLSPLSLSLSRRVLKFIGYVKKAESVSGQQCRIRSLKIDFGGICMDAGAGAGSRRPALAQDRRDFSHCVAHFSIRSISQTRRPGCSARRAAGDAALV